MTDKRMRLLVSQVITAARPVAEKYYHVCWWEGALACHPVRHTKEAHEVFFSAPGSVLADDLSGFQWQLLTQRIADFCAQGA